MSIYWTTREGKKVDIDKMSPSHLRNALKMVVKHYGQPKQKKQKTITCPDCNGTGQIVWGISDAWGTDGGYDTCESCEGNGTVNYGNTQD